MRTSKEVLCLEPCDETTLSMVRMALSIGDEAAAERILTHAAPHNPNGILLHK